MFAIQSTQADPKKLVYEIKDFLGKFNQSLSSFNKKEYVIMRDALIQKLTQEPQTLHEQCSHWWSLIENGENDFHQDEKIAKILSTVELNDIAKFAHQVLDPNAKQGELFVLSAPLSTPAHYSEIASTKALKRGLSFVG